MPLKLHLILFFLLTWAVPSVHAQNFFRDVEEIKYHLSHQQLQLHLKNNEPVPGVYLYSFMDGQNRPLYDSCPSLELKKLYPSYRVLFVLEDRPYITGVMRMGPDDLSQVHAVLWQDPGEDNSKSQLMPTPPKSKDKKSEDAPTVYFKHENIDDLIAYANETVEFHYASGMQVPKVLMPDSYADRTYIDSTQINWVKRADLRLHLSSQFQLVSGLQIQETLGPSDPKKAENSGSMERMTFHTNQVNAQVGTETQVSQNVKIKAGIVYEESPYGKSAGVLSGVDIRVPRGSIMVFTSFKAPIEPGSPAFFLPVPAINQGGAAGIRYQGPYGLEVRGGVTGLGSEAPRVETGVSIPLDFSPKSK